MSPDKYAEIDAMFDRSGIQDAPDKPLNLTADEMQAIHADVTGEAIPQAGTTPDTVDTKPAVPTFRTGFGSWMFPKAS